MSVASQQRGSPLTWPSGGHNGGCLEFGQDGMLYISTGDGSGPNPPDGRTSGQDVSDLLGSILRIDVDHKSADKLYTVPADNPFVENKLGLPKSGPMASATPGSSAPTPSPATSSRPTTAGRRGRWFTRSSAAATAAGR